MVNGISILSNAFLFVFDYQSLMLIVRQALILFIQSLRDQRVLEIFIMIK